MRRVDDQQIQYVRECSEAELDGVIATEQNHPGRIISMAVVPA